MKKAKESRIGRPSELEGAWGRLAVAVGGIRPLAEAIGVSPRTIQRYENGELEPHTLRVETIRSLCREHGIRPYAV